MSQKEQDTEQKIKEAARKIFQEKGFAATKTRDIADAAGINLALLNYYYRSKRKLFDMIMIETLQSFFGGVLSILNDRETGIKDKITNFVNHYMDILSENPEMAGFIMNAVREDPNALIEKIGILEKAKSSYFIEQFQEAVKTGYIPGIDPIHFILNLMGLTVFPFIAQPLISVAVGMPREMFIEMIQERRRLIPLWVESMLSVE